MRSPIDPFLEDQGYLVLDGGLATQLEALGADLAGGLWSAELLFAEPETIERVHLDYFRAGADCATTASYQASYPGLEERGLGAEAIDALMLSSVALAASARDRFWDEPGARAGRLRPLVAASIGPYGAYRADGSEYTGDYDASEDELFDFHARRLALFAGSDADVLACETIPNAVEARALARVLAEHPDVRAWVGFCCGDETHLSDGTPLGESAACLAELDQVVAVGVNCTSPAHVSALLEELRPVTQKPLVAYPNSGERFDGVEKTWSGDRSPVAFGEAARSWRAAGAALIGGCCRTAPAHIAQVRGALFA